MDCDKPSRNKIDEVMEHVCIGDSIHCSIYGDEEKEHASEMAETRSDPRYHFPTGERLNQKNKRHDGKDVVMRRKWRKPVYSQVVYPDHEYWKVDRKNPEHENEDRVGVIVEVEVRVGSCFSCETKCTSTSGDLYKTCYKICELVWDDG